MKTTVSADGYKVLLNKVRKTLIEGQRRIEQERVRTYWPIGSLREEESISDSHRKGDRDFR